MEVVQNANRRSNMLLRSFSIRRPEVFMKLFNTYVLPILLYASPVWSPGLKRDRERLENVQKRYIRRVAFKCGVRRTDITYVPISDLLTQQDERIFAKIRKDSDRFSRMFSTVLSNTRRGVNIMPRVTARKTVVANLFPWRITAKLHNSVIL